MVEAVSVAVGVCVRLPLVEGVGLCERVPDDVRVELGVEEPDEVAEPLGDPVEEAVCVTEGVGERVVVPEGVGLELRVPVIEKVCVRDGVAVPLRVAVPERVCVWLGESVTLGVCVVLAVWLGVFDGEHTDLTARRPTAQKAVSTDHADPPSLLTHAPVATAKPDTGVCDVAFASAGKFQLICVSAERTSA